MTWTPSERAKVAISAESVLTKMCPPTLLALAIAIVRSSTGIPARSRVFLPGIRLEPPRAGITTVGSVGSDTGLAYADDDANLS